VPASSPFKAISVRIFRQLPILGRNDFAQPGELIEDLKGQVVVRQLIESRSVFRDAALDLGRQWRLALLQCRKPSVPNQVECGVIVEPATVLGDNRRQDP
jgi:hypothetical protein